MRRSPMQQHKVDECDVDEAMQGLPLVVGGEQGWHSGRAPLTLGSAQRCSVCLERTSASFSPNQSLTTPANLIRCCCPQICSPCLPPRHHLHRRRRHHRPPPPSTNKNKKYIYIFSTVNLRFASLPLCVGKQRRDSRHRRPHPRWMSLPQRTPSPALLHRHRHPPPPPPCPVGREIFR